MTATPEPRTGRYHLNVQRDHTAFQRALEADVRRGLTAPQKILPPKYFYDGAGSALFDRITELPEYYLTRVERGIVTDVAASLMAEVQPAELVELGAGVCAKIRWLVDARNGAAPGQRLLFVPVDVDAHTLDQAAQGLLKSYDFLDVHGVIGDFESDLRHIPPPEGRRLVVFFGSTLGNLDGTERQALLTEVHDILRPGDYFLLGVDLVKDVQTLETAYNDSAGVTAAFNRNVLHVINRALDADFDVDTYDHYAYFNAAESRIEMHLRPRVLQHVRVRALDLAVTVTPDETIWTESSHKFTEQSIRRMLAATAFEPVRWDTDPDNMFALVLARRS